MNGRVRPVVAPGPDTLEPKDRSGRRWIGIVLVLAVAVVSVGLWIYPAWLRPTNASSRASCGTVGGASGGNYVESYPRLYVTVPPSQKPHLTCFLSAVSASATASLKLELNGIDTNSVSVLRTQAGRISETGTYRVMAGAPSTSTFADVCTVSSGVTPPTLRCGSNILIFGPYNG